MSHRHTRQNVGKYKILQMWWGRKRRRKKVKHRNIRIIDRPSFRGEEIQRTSSCVLSTQLFPLCWSLSFFLVKVSKSECVSHVWQAAKSGDICVTWYVIKMTFVLRFLYVNDEKYKIILFYAYDCFPSCICITYVSDACRW